MITPTNGRIVWYHPSHHDTKEHHVPVIAHSDTLAAIITHVWSDTCVNLTVFDSNGTPHGRTSVNLVQDGEAQSGPYCEWMPFQKGQAAKTEHLEKQLAPPQEQQAPIGGSTGSTDPMPEHVSAAGSGA